MSEVHGNRISVCIANYNGEKLLRDCLDSVLAQPTWLDIEIIVHDDASTDASVELLRGEYPQVRVIASQHNVGFCIANNRMADVASGHYMLLLNNDAALAPDALEAFLAEQQNIAGPCVLTLPQYDWESGVLVDRGCLLDPFYNPVPNLDPIRQDVAYVIGACLWVERRLWQQLGGFPEWMESIGEDLYLCSLVRLRGLAVRCVNGSGYRHRQGASFGGNRAGKTLSTTYRRRALSERNKTWVLRLCTPGRLMWPFLLLHLVLLCMEGVVISLLRRDYRLWREVYAAAVRQALLHDWDSRGLRQHLQAQRRTGQREWWRVFVWVPRKLSLLLRYGVPELR